LNAPYIFSARKKLTSRHVTGHPSTDYRATVVGCAISATRNYLKLQVPRTLNLLLSNVHAETQKLWKRSAMRIAASRTNADDGVRFVPVFRSTEISRGEENGTIG
jgi:hypothetical protein